MYGPTKVTLLCLMDGFENISRIQKRCSPNSLRTQTMQNYSMVTHSGGLVRCFFVTEPPVSPFSLFFCTTHQHIEKSYSICFMLLLVVLKPSSRWRNGPPYSEKTSSNTSIQELLVVFVCPSTIRGFPGKERMAWH